jgi:cobaltochelatase CobS
MTTKLMQEIKDMFYVAIRTNPDGTFFKDADGNLEILEDGHKQEGSKIRHAVKRLFADDYPDLYAKVEAHTGMTFYKATERTPPFVVFLMASGHITPEEYATKILEAPKDPKDVDVVANYIPEEKFKETLYDSYRVWYEEQSSNAPAVGLEDFKLFMPNKEQLQILDVTLPAYGLPSYSEIFKQFKALSESGDKINTLATALDSLTKEAKKREKEFNKTVSKLSSELAMKPFKDTVVIASGEIPNGKIVNKPANSVFPDMKIKFDIPVWEWDGPHPDVPAIDEDYIFREDLLVRALYAIISNQRMYLQGDTGSGKTTLVEQVAARLNWPFARINFDSEITRMDLIGRDTMKDGKTSFIDGMLPRMMSGPYISVFDELDFCRPDVAYVMQAALEGNGLVITEDGGRRVMPNPMFRMFGTGNTVGQGDEKGMYQGARPQSIAFLDRFTIWAKVEYLDEKQRKELLTKRVPSLTEEEVTTIIKYSTEHLAAFNEARVLQPISPRGMIAVGRTLAHMNAVYPGDKKNLNRALQMVVLDRATNADHLTLKGIVDRVCKV